MKYTTLAECLIDVRSYNEYEHEVKQIISEIKKIDNAESEFQRAVDENWIRLAQKTKPQVLLENKLSRTTFAPTVKNRSIELRVFGKKTNPTPVIVVSIK